MRPDVSRQAGHIAAAVVEAEPEPPRQSREFGIGLDSAVQLAHPRPDIGQSADTARQRGGDDVAHPLMAHRGQQPGGGDRFGDRGGSPIPRICRLPRAVNSRVPPPNRSAASARAPSAAGPIIPPGSRMRARAPSAA